MTDRLTITTQEAATHTIRPFKRVEWTPQPDITAHELAKIMPVLISMGLRPLNYWEDFIPADALRHFTITDQ